MSDQLGTLTNKSGHGSNTKKIREHRSGDWSGAGSGSTVTNWGVITQLQVEADEMEEQIEALLEKDPIGAAKSEIGRFVLSGYSFLMDGTYPFKFEGPDLIKDGMLIQAQLLA